jgi:hypothetical protein
MTFLGEFDLTQWEKDVAKDLDGDIDALEILLDFVSADFQEDFLHNLLDSVHSYKVKIELRSKGLGEGQTLGNPCLTHPVEARKSVQDVGVSGLPTTYCPNCSFKCQATECDCTCHDKME